MRKLTPEERKAKIDNIIRIFKEIEELTAECQNGQDVTPAHSDENSAFSSIVEIQHTFPFH